MFARSLGKIAKVSNGQKDLWLLRRGALESRVGMEILVSSSTVLPVVPVTAPEVKHSYHSGRGCEKG